MRPARPLLVAFLAAAVTFSAFAVPTASARPDTAAASQMAAAINHVRARHGLRPLRVSGSLNSSAARFSQGLMARDVFAHAGRVQASRRFRSLGEVLMKMSGRRYRVRRAVRAWMHSAGHRMVLLHPSFRAIGAGATRGRFRGRRATIWVVQVGR